MSLSTNQSRGTADPVDVEYLHHEPEGAAPGIHMHLDAMDGIARDVMEGFKALPRRGVEVGGLLLGKVIGSEHPDVWIERYQRIECRHRFGPQFVLDEADHAALEEAAQRIAASTELAVIGLYRSHTRSGLQLEQSDLELVGRYFSDPSDLVLLIRPENMVDIEAQFFARDVNGAMQPLGEPFPFRGRTLGPADFMLVEEPDEEDAAEATRQTTGASPGFAGNGLAETELAGDVDVKYDPVPDPVVGDAPPEADHAAAETPSVAGAPSQPEVAGPSQPDPAKPAPRERMRRLVPDFAPAAEPVEPGGVFSFEPRLAPPPPPQFTVEDAEPSRLRAAMAKWWPLAGAVILVCAVIWVLLGQTRRGPSSSGGAGEIASPQEYRPVGMYVDPGPQRWRISWNSSATAFQNARNVALFVRDGDAEDRVDLTKQDVDAGAYTWQPKGNDVTFRLEAIDAAGRISAESFRVIRQGSSAAPSAASAPAASAPASLPAGAPAASEPAAHAIPAKAIHKVPPVVPASIRPRIHGVIPVDIRVHINALGRVTSAVPTVKAKPGLNAYLASRAVYAARLWRFTPARENGKPAASTQTIHFVFEK
ncbi:MAG TPA: hypothetical protein VG345_11805 [Bryobacteraceae bacterium]|nr:hypothetical protein [Bryobacteraceae bacterium]